jgi:hypothetical protein
VRYQNLILRALGAVYLCKHTISLNEHSINNFGFDTFDIRDEFSPRKEEKLQNLRS